MFKKYYAVVMLVLVAAGLMITFSTARTQEPELIGTWKVTVPAAGDVPGFEALQTFHADGTFTETSSLLGQKEEGPAHGVWIRNGDHYNLVFLLFAFDKESGKSTGMFRVALNIQLDSANHWTAQTGSVHFIRPDGTMELLDDGSNSAPIEASRLTVEQM